MIRKHNRMASADNQLPANAHRVFKGTIFEVWQWEQVMFDGSTQTFERLKRNDSVQVIASVGNKIVIQDQEQPDRTAFVSFPGGRCDGNEEPLAAAQRELKEETGYVSDEWHLLRSVKPYDKMIYTVHTFIARSCIRKSQQMLDSGEKIQNRLISFDDFLALADNPQFRNRIFVGDLLRARYEPQAREELRRALFG